MRKSILTILIFFTVVCSISAKHKKHKHSKGPEIESVTVSHGACFGRCPIYTIEVSKNGMVRYTGIRYIKDSGVYEKNIGTDAVTKLFDQFNFYRVDTCPDAYNNRIPDVSGTFYKITYSDKIKNIANAQFGAEFLGTLAVSVNNLAKIDSSWKHITASQK